MPARVGADVGGTFTDVILQRADGTIRLRKVLSTPPDYDRAVAAGVEDLLPEAGGPLADVVHGTTVATNAVLERRGARTALVTTAGFRDVLELRRVRMPHLYDLFWEKPLPLVERVLRLELGERMSASGDVLRPLNDDEVRALAARLRELDVESVAVCLLHAHRHPAHEERAGTILRAELPDVAVSLSSEVIREQQEYERTAAAVVNAYVRPLMSRYVGDLRSALDGIGVDASVAIMQSSGGVMTDADAALRPVYALESGPAAGVIAALGLAERLGIANAIAFDMGGTSAKASLIENGRISRSREYEVGAALSAGSRLLRGSGELIRIPTIDIAEVGAGGGSIAWLDGAGTLHVGPRSAGADPGPACYGRGGAAATVTDANVVLGYIPTGRLASGELDVSTELAHAALAAVGEPLGLSALEAARAVHRLANASMMRALRAVSSEKGRDPRDFALIAYGGSGPVHAASLADELGVSTVLVPPLAGLFSAAGLLFARTEFHDVRFCDVDARAGDGVALLAELDREMRASLRSLIGDVGELEWQRSADVRYRGQSWDIEVDLPGDEIGAETLAAVVERFEAEHERTYGVRHDPGSPVVIRALRLTVLGPPPETASIDVGTRTAEAGARLAAVGPDGGQQDVGVVSRSSVPEQPVAGPLLVDEYDTTVVVPPGWTVRRDESGTLVLERAGAVSGRGPLAVDAVTQEIVAHAFASVADEMATTIFRTAHSTVVRDVMDFSASLCDPAGETVAQAVTLPNHLGSIPTAMATLLASYSDDLRPGDIFAMNDPFSGGIHTSDIYLVKPVFHGHDTHIGFAVTTAHHGDVGGRVPGTTACDNTDIFQEGLRLPWLRLYRDGNPVEDIFKIIRANVRIPTMALGDLRAQIAACTIGERGLQELADRHGAEALRGIMTGLVDSTEQLVRREISGWPDGTASFVDYLDSDGIDERNVRIAVDVTISGDEVITDFSGSDPMVRGALNSTKSFVEANVYQAVISAVREQIPTTSGAFRPIRVITKPGTVTHVVMPGASSMRGVTGFRIFDAVNGALAELVPHRIPAAGEGGNTLAIFSALRPDGERFVYYELVVGTWGARPTSDGNDGLSNPCATVANIPVEVAESEYPILIERYGLVPDTGGAGRYRGGLAVERSWRALTPETSLQVRSDRQRHQPYGLAGGGGGATSRNLVAGDSFPPMFSTTIGVGTVFHHTMPGGGGWGDPFERDLDAVARDVRNEKVTPAAARDLYGVVVDEAGSVDAAATEQLRARLRAAREEDVA